MNAREVKEEEFFWGPGPFAGEPKFTELEVGEAPSAIQAVLEAPNIYGTGNVEVSAKDQEAAELGLEPYLIAFKGELAGMHIPLSTEVSPLFGFVGTFALNRRALGTQLARTARSP